ncbi:hypothetical protein [Photobacterium damselae]|uniref:hypothetical protein n=1 Tax=Photobacterium damselae TaxID=38293 RepID=UPI004067AB46
MQYLILLIAAMTFVIYVNEKVADTENKEQPELVVGGWKRFINNVKAVFKGSKAEAVKNEKAKDEDEKSEN